MLQLLTGQNVSDLASLVETARNNPLDFEKAIDPAAGALKAAVCLPTPRVLLARRWCCSLGRLHRL